MRLVLGTAQFGSNYGIANVAGKVPSNELKRILNLARAHGVDTLDTAIAYGNAESRLGKLGVDDFRIVTKVPALPTFEVDINTWLLAQVRKSLSRLRVPRLHGLLLHHPPDFMGHTAIRLVQAMARVRDAGLVNRIGASIYALSDLKLMDEMGLHSLVQAPMNVFDRRIVESGLLARLQSVGVEVHLRSVFLQGLLLMPATKVPASLKVWLPHLERWHAWCDEQALTPLQACLAHANSKSSGAKIVVGCESAQQFEEILEASYQSPHTAPAEFTSNEEHLINPSLWTNR